MPEFNNLLQAEAYYREEAQAKAEGRDANHAEIPEPEAEPDNTVFNSTLGYDPHVDPESLTESGSPYVESSDTVAPAFDPGVLTPHSEYNSDGTSANPPVAEEVTEPAEGDDLTNATIATNSDTPQE